MTSIDVSTYSIAESVCAGMNGRVAFEDVLAVWHAIGECAISDSLLLPISPCFAECICCLWLPVGGCVKSQLAQRKAVKLRMLGTFTLSNTQPALPVFVMGGDMAAAFKLKQTSTPPISSIPTSNLNLVQLSEIVSFIPC
jgi:hypothetical protein